MQPKIQPHAPVSPLDQDASCLKISDDGHAIFIEECYRMRRATFDQEPVKEEPLSTDRDDPAYWRDSGPRFAVRIDL
jgi:hypothetical protein